jgi:glycosyltransferase involved in cell wall biosynthesis
MDAGAAYLDVIDCLKVLHVIRSVDPKGGGPIEGVRQYGSRLLEMGHSVEVVSLDDPAADFVAAFPLKVHALGPAKNKYGYNRGLVSWLKARARSYDRVIVNGLWQYHSFAAWRAISSSGTPYFVFTHGMLDPWFKTHYPLKHLKKMLYWPAEYRVLRDAEAVLFTSDEERLLARQSFKPYRAREQVVAYGTAPPPPDGALLRAKFLARHPELHDRRIILFLSRIHEKKGCDLLIEAFAEVACSDAQYHLVIAGPDQTRWVPQLQDLAIKLGVAGRISWLGMVRGEEKWSAFYSAEVFALPSHQENFGIAVAEALGCGLPVLISNKVNIWREVHAANAGLVAPDSLAGTKQLLREWLNRTPQQRFEMGEAAKRLFASRFTVDAMTQDLLRIYRAESGKLPHAGRLCDG